MTRRSIPAWHDNVLYRSHTEARWKIFFKTLGVESEYEPQGYDTDGVAYLPDFLVHGATGKIWLEIKPSWEADGNGIEKWRLFAAQRPQPSRAALVIGQPALRAVHIVIGGDEESGDPLRGPWEDDQQEWRSCLSGEHFDLANPGTFRSKFAEDGCRDDFGRGGEEKIEAAARAALGHRFGRFQPPQGTAALWRASGRSSLSSLRPRP